MLALAELRKVIVFDGLILELTDLWQYQHTVYFTVTATLDQKALSPGAWDLNRDRLILLHRHLHTR